MGVTLDSLAARPVVGHWPRWLAVSLCLVATLACWQPVMAADESAAVTPAEEWVPHEYTSTLIAWDPEAETYRAGDEEGTFAYLLSLPEATGWQFVTILAESWTEATVDEQPAFDVFRWRAIYRRPFEMSDAPAE